MRCLREPMRVAAIDIGTNSTRLLIAETDGVAIERELYRQTVITRLGQEVHATSHLKAEAVARTISALKEYAKIAADYKVEVTAAVATSAVRDADNFIDLLAPAAKTIGATPEIIPGETEARLTYAGVMAHGNTRTLGATFLVIDIGGGSTEIIFGNRQRPELLNSLPLGCVRLTETFFGYDPPPAGAITALRLHVRRVLSDSFSRLIGVNTIPIAVAGTPTSLAAIALKLEKYDRAKVHGYRLTRLEVIGQLETLARAPLHERQNVVGLEPQRADVIVAGAAILLEIMTFFDFEHVFVSEYDILDGIALGAV